MSARSRQALTGAAMLMYYLPVLNIISFPYQGMALQIPRGQAWEGLYSNQPNIPTLVLCHFFLAHHPLSRRPPYPLLPPIPCH